MILTIDIGNSYITLGGFDGGSLIFVSELMTQPRRTKDQLAVELVQIMGLHKMRADRITGAIISSVVPDITDVVLGAVKIISGITAAVVGPGIKTGIKIAIDNPAQLGADLVSCAVSAADKKRLPCIIYDMGTTNTISVLDKHGCFVGAVIAAGVGTTLEMFTTRTALLPRVNIEAPKSVIGKNTAASMQSGLIYGTAAMLDGLAERIEEELGESVYIFATGSRAADIIPHCRRNAEICEYMALDGLRLIYEKNNKQL